MDDTYLYDDWMLSLGAFGIEYNKIMKAEFWVAIIASIVQVVILAALIRRETRGKDSKWKGVFTQVNCFLLLSILANCLTFVFIQAGKGATDTSTYQALYILSYITFYGYQFLIVFYTLNRGLPVIQALIPKSKIFFIAVVVVIFLMAVALIVLSFYLILEKDPVTFAIVTVATNYLQVACEVIMFLFDLAVMTCYGFYLRHIRIQGYAFDVERLCILSRYGIASFVVFQLFLGASSALSQLYIIPQVVMSSTTLPLWLTLTHVQNLSPLVYSFIQLQMKWSLQNEKQNRLKTNMKSIENARNASNPTKNSSGNNTTLSMAASEKDKQR
ncbi:hypothetical protein BDR26DRAFT_851822 [Obelidium mucronatum]|nr:hypothetical protein BDR26DRAFT_851822 [Obelidium mucronatum]